MSSRRPVASLGRACALVFVVACAVRLALLTSPLVPREWLLPETGSEVGRVARSLAETGRFADPYLLPTGPTAHPAPVWPGILALLYRLFGFSLAGGTARAVVGIACFAAPLAVLPWFAVRAGLGLPAGLVAGLVGALVPQQGPAEMIGWSATEPLAAASLVAPIPGLAPDAGREDGLRGIAREGGPIPRQSIESQAC